MYLAKTPYLLGRLFKKKLLWKVDTSKKILYLTFDDGPIPEVTPKVLSLLKEYNAKATFFMVGENAQKYPEIYEQVVQAGHAVGNHCFNHLKGFSTKNFTYYKNILMASDFVAGALFRPPHGQITPLQIKVLSKRYRIIMWTVLSGDYDPKRSPEHCAKTVLRHAKNGSIIVMHDSLKAKRNMLFTLEEALKHFSKLGYQFESLAQGE